MLKPMQKRIVMGDLLGISSRCAAAAKEAKELRLLVEKVAEGLFPDDADREAAEAGMEELRGVLAEAAAMAHAVARTMGRADLFGDGPDVGGGNVKAEEREDI